MLPVVALVGRPNVGKSTLFNRLTKTRDALVVDLPGATRDRKFGDVDVDGQRFIIVDTGGLGESESDDPIRDLMAEQTQLAIEQSQLVLMVCDMRIGLTSVDEKLADQLRRSGKRVMVVANKMDGIDAQVAVAEFHQLGFASVVPIAAAQGRGINILLEGVFAIFESQSFAQKTDETIPLAGEDDRDRIRVAVVGRPNVGKSTLVNRLLGEERVVAFNLPGTTRDSIAIPFERRDQKYTLIDTAGVRRRAKVERGLEKFSVVKALQALDMAHVAILLVDSQEDLTDQDLHLIQYTLDSGTGLIIALNKWDHLSDDQRQKVLSACERKLGFVSHFVKILPISALHGTAVGDLFPMINRIHRSLLTELSTKEVNEALQQALMQHQPPLSKGRRIRLQYAHCGGHQPPLIVIHGKQTEALPDAYRRYLEKFMRDYFKLYGVPIRLVFKSAENPYATKTKKG